MGPSHPARAGIAMLHQPAGQLSDGSAGIVAISL
jgi:hypothetical protein